MKLSKILSTITLAAAGLAINSAANAALIDQSTTADAEYAQVYQNGTAINLTIEGAGVTRVVTMAVSNYTYGVGYNYWKGVVPNDAVVDDGVATISVNIANTCTDATTTATYGSDYCYAVNATFTKNDYLWKTNGVTQYTWGDIIYQIVGGISAFSASTTGTVNDVDISSSRAYIGRYTNVNIMVTTAN
jgi:hypothetical protein